MLMKKESRQSGHCIICDNHYSHIKSHYRKLHHLECNEIDIILSIVGENSIYYMPSEFRLANLTIPNGNNNQVSFVNYENNHIENEQEITDEQLQGFYIVKHSNWKEIEIICADCGLMMGKKHAFKHRNEHLNNKIDENNYSRRRKKSKIKKEAVLR
ncbi:hypothetical protein SteCoe_10951 [Stentor coeruleus]|uniref:Uncharacterized protein n=1 Tax=Stentor coeruleus TaxID=5963 RepID=A0A1R2CEH7_9CILI|nr:hypothetical protein SteCoe_10951 [Stentor coeruleus]